MPFENEKEQDFARVGMCAILGLPNVGKSTLLNKALGMRLVAVSPKPQTTRNRILGVRNLDLPAIGDDSGGAAQVIFIDTPGVQSGKGALRRFMRNQALVAASDCDVALVMVDAANSRQSMPADLANTEFKALIDVLLKNRTKMKTILVLNKIDRLNAKEQLLPMIAAHNKLGQFDEVIPISAKNGKGIDTLLLTVARNLPLGPRLFPEEMYTDRAERFLAAELIREQLFLQLDQELPYASAVVIERFKERSDKGDLVVSAVIHVERESQKGMVIGKGGSRIKMIGERARKSLAELFGCEVHLKLFVKVSEGWSQKDSRLKEMGYDDA